MLGMLFRRWDFRVLTVVAQMHEWGLRSFSMLLRKVRKCIICTRCFLRMLNRNVRFVLPGRACCRIFDILDILVVNVG